MKKGLWKSCLGRKIKKTKIKLYKSVPGEEKQKFVKYRKIHYRMRKNVLL